MATTPDKNYLSLSGDASGNIWKNGLILFTADQPGIREVDLGDVIPDDTTYNDTLKISGAERLTVRVGRLVGSIEDCVDINHSHNVSVVIGYAEPKGKYVSTIKGGSTGIILVVENQIGHGSETDYDLGNFTEASQDKTTDIHITVIHNSDSSWVRVINADTPSVSGNIRISKPWWAYFPFWAIYTVLRLHSIIPA